MNDYFYKLLSFSRVKEMQFDYFRKIKIRKLLESFSINRIYQFLSANTKIKGAKWDLFVTKCIFFVSSLRGFNIEFPSECPQGLCGENLMGNQEMDQVPRKGTDIMMDFERQLHSRTCSRPWVSVWTN